MHKYSTIGFVLHRRCNASCSICCMSSSPTCKEELDASRIKDLILQTKNHPEITCIAFTGGEAFMDIDKLMDLVAVAKSVDKIATCVTNGYWATSYDIAFNILSKLKSQGLVRLDVSCDQFHLEYVPIENINNILLACQKLGIRNVVNMLRLKDETVGDIVDRFDTQIQNISLKVASCFHVGAAKDNFSKDMFMHDMDPCGQVCPYSGNITVGYDGSVYPCCSQYITDTILSVGQYTDLNFENILEKLKNNGILYLLRNRNMDHFIEAAKEVGITIPEYISSPCELCAMLFNRENITKFMPYVKDEMSRLGLA